MAAAKEKWKPIIGYEGFYEISSLGRVRSLPRTIVRQMPWGTQTFTQPMKYISLKPNARGYVNIRLTAADGEYAQFWLHRLLCEHFVGPPPFDGALARHKDDDKTNNSIGNLEWGDKLDNADDAVRNNRYKRGASINTARLTDKIVRRVVSKLRSRVPMTHIAEELGVSVCAISDIKHGRSWTHVTGLRSVRRGSK